MQQVQPAKLHKLRIPVIHYKDGYLCVDFEHLTSLKPCKKLSKANTPYSDKVLLHTDTYDVPIVLMQIGPDSWRTILPLSDYITDEQIIISYMGYMYYG